MYRRNVANQAIFFTLTDILTGLPKTGASVTVRYAVDLGAQAVGGGVVTELGNGQYRYVPLAAELNGIHIGFLFAAADCITINANIVTDADVVSDIWASPVRTFTQPAAQILAGLSGSTLTILRGDTLIIVMTGLGSLANRSNLYFAVKVSLHDSDNDAVILIDEVTGLLYLNKESAATPANGSITIDDQTLGNITITLAADETMLLVPAANLSYDIQIIRSSGIPVSTLTSGKCKIVADVTRTIA